MTEFVTGHWTEEDERKFQLATQLPQEVKE